MLIVPLRPIFWSIAILSLLWVPVVVADLLTLRMSDPTRCTLDAKTCDRLRQN